MHISRLATAVAVGALTLADAKACPPFGAVLPAPTAPSQSKEVKSAVTLLKSAIEKEVASAFKTSGISIGVKSIHEDDALLTYHFTPPTGSGIGVTKIGDDTMYRIASGSKLFPVLAALQNSKVDMSASVLKYLPELNKTSGSDPVLSLDWEEITVGSLAGHLSGLGVDLAQDLGVVGSKYWTAMGLPEFSAKTGPSCSGLAGTPACTKQDFLDQINRRPPVYAPDTTPVYSNVGIALLGLVVEAATNKTIEEVITEDILDVVGMKHTSTGKVPATNKLFVPEGDSVWNLTTGVFDGAGGMYSSLSDMQAFCVAILQNKLLSPAETRKWLKPVASTASWGLMVGHPWEILRSDNITSDGRLIDVYTKSGDLGLYHSLIGLVPDYDLAITVLSAGEEATESSAATLAFNAVLKSLLPIIEAVGRTDAKNTYVGQYSDDSTNSSLTLKMDNGPGLVISEWKVRGYDVLTNFGGYSWATLAAGNVTSDPPTDARVYPTNLKHNTETAWRAVFDYNNSTEEAALDSELFFKNASCQTWFAQDRKTYNFLSLDEFLFDSSAKTIASPAFNITLTKVGTPPSKISTSAVSGTMGAFETPGIVLSAALVMAVVSVF